MQWHTQAGNITTNLKVKLDFTLSKLSAKNVMTWKFYVDEYDMSVHDMILGQDILTELLLVLKISEHVIGAKDGPFEGSTTPMFDLGTYIFKDLNTGKITSE